MKTAKFLSARITQADLKDGPSRLSVEGATVDPYVDPKTSQTEQKLTLRFEGGRTLILNKTNLNVLIEGFGDGRVRSLGWQERDCCLGSQRRLRW